MKILFISSSNMIATNLAYVLKQEGHKVKLFIDDVDRKDNFENIVEKTDDWHKELSWVGKGKNSLIIFDDIGYGKIQDQLRKNGYSVFGGSELADRLESDRQYAHEIFTTVGIKTVPVKNFNGILSAIDFIKKNKEAWVIKQNDSASKSLNYVGQFDDGRDVINVLENYQKNVKGQMRTITLQQKIHGIEIAVARYFNGSDWVGPIEVNEEHKKLFPGDLGPMTSEMGTLAWYEDNENNKLFQETLLKLKPHLQKINFKGAIDINCIVNQTGAYPLEATPRFGSPIIYLQNDIHQSPWGELLKAIADGRNYDLKWKRGYGIVVLVTVPPFPYTKKLREMSPKGIDIHFNKTLRESDFKHIHFEGVSLRNRKGKGQYYVSDHQGYILYATAVQPSVELARRKVNKLIKKIHIPKMFYRHDIGIGFIEETYDKLHAWGYL